MARIDTKETLWDKKLIINTCGRDDSMEDENHFPYEPTPYSVLERLADSGYITEQHVVIDYGCGKGRVGIFLSHKTGCHAIGIEFDQELYACALDNQRACPDRKRVNIILANAETYHVDTASDAFYFFNPFSIKILQSVIGKILDSWYRQPREMTLYFYYPSDEYLAYLMTVPELEFLDEIDCSDLFDGDNSRERIIVFEIV